MPRDWNNATLEECCDFIAESKGWKPPGHTIRNALGHDCQVGQWTSERDCLLVGAGYDDGGAGIAVARHPIPATLDSIAGSLPEGWRWMNIEYISHARCGCKCGPQYKVLAEKGEDPRSWRDPESRADYIDMLLAMARCAASAWEAEKGGSHDHE